MKQRSRGDGGLPVTLVALEGMGAGFKVSFSRGVTRTAIPFRPTHFYQVSPTGFLVRESVLEIEKAHAAILPLAATKASTLKVYKCKFWNISGMRFVKESKQKRLPQGGYTMNTRTIILSLALVPTLLILQVPARADTPKDLTTDKVDIKQDVYDLHKDVKDLKEDRAEIKTDRETLRTDLSAYKDAVETFGRNSSQAKAAEANVDAAQVALHQQMGDFRQESWGAYKDRRDLVKDVRDFRNDRDTAKDRTDTYKDAYDLRKDVKDMKEDRAEIKADRATLRADLDAYWDAVKQYGRNSSQAQAAEANVDAARVALHKQIGDFVQERWDAHKDHQDLVRDVRESRHDRLEHAHAAIKVHVAEPHRS